jgi:pantothenate synthetase
MRIEMNYSWPASNPLLDEALKIVIDSLAATGQAEINKDTEQLAAEAVLSEWRADTMHRIRLVNAGIVAAEEKLALSKRSGNLRLDALRDLTLPDC